MWPKLELVWGLRSALANPTRQDGASRNGHTRNGLPTTITGAIGTEGKTEVIGTRSHQSTRQQGA